MSSVLISDLTAERMPPPSRRPDRSEVLQFDHNKLQHVPVTEKVVLPSQQGIYKYIWYIFFVWWIVERSLQGKPKFNWGFLPSGLVLQKLKNKLSNDLFHFDIISKIIFLSFQTFMMKV